MGSLTYNKDLQDFINSRFAIEDGLRPVSERGLSTRQYTKGLSRTRGLVRGTGSIINTSGQLRQDDGVMSVRLVITTGGTMTKGGLLGVRTYHGRGVISVYSKLRHVGGYSSQDNRIFSGLGRSIVYRRR